MTDTIADLRRAHPLYRIDGAQQQLMTAIWGNRRTPFVWGQWDCFLWACKAVEVQTGVDMGAPFRGSYASALESARVLKAHGAAVDTMFDVLGFVRVHPRCAGRGDVAWCVHQEHGATGVVSGFEVWVAGPEGLVPWPRETIHHAWRVG